jgi:hypothetical protein
LTAALATRASDLRARLEALDRAASNVAEVSALEGLRAGLARRADKLGSELAKRNLLASAQIAVTAPASLTAAQKRAAGLLEKFQAEPKAATLKRGQGWNTLLSEVDNAGRDLASAVVGGWKGHRQAVFAGETPAQIRGKLARTPANDKAFEKYEALYTRLKAAFEALPPDAAAIAATGKIANDLQTAAKDFDFDVPTDVKQFLEAVLSIKGAPLSLLTPSVLEWLANNGGLDSYAVRSTGGS